MHFIASAHALAVLSTEKTVFIVIQGDLICMTFIQLLL